ncbi:MAG TPA: hypothetical protein VLJ62_20565 [Burkholderiaceae bacterium]|nr:hypothetical protein [Burkholderiaceae bacterium]
MNRFFNSRTLGVALLMGGIVVSVGLANQYVESRVEQAVRHNFTAAGLLAKMQVQAERMRRFEKEMFIYAATPDKQAKYAKEFDEAHTKLLTIQNQAASLQLRAFSEAERATMSKWMDATAFYTHEFGKTVATAKSAQQTALTPDQRAELTLKLNNDIGAGKDRFRALLDGSAAMREAKEAASLEINNEVSTILRRVWMALAVMAVAVTLGAALRSGRSVQSRAREAGPTRPAMART